MAKKVLITDSLFIYDEHVKKIEAAGFVVERLDKPDASEAELSLALRDKHGYVLGGIEQVTDPVIASATNLEAIAFTGSGYTEFIPAYDKATKQGIAISAAVGGNAIDVAEFTVAVIFEMVRNLPLLQTAKELGGKGFYIGHRIRGLKIGVVGYGHIGKEVALLAQSVGMKVMVAARHSLKLPSGMDQVSLDELLMKSDVVTVHVNKHNGAGVLGASEIRRMKNGAILVNTAFPEAVHLETLGTRVAAGELRAVFDAPPPFRLDARTVGDFVSSNAQTAFNTAEANRAISDRVTQSIINLLTTGNDKDLVNTEYRSFRKDKIRTGHQA